MTSTCTRINVAISLTISFIIICGISFYYRSNFIEMIHEITKELNFSDPYAWIISILMQILVTTSGFIPAAVLCATAGVIYGIWVGFLLSTIGTLFGAVIAFMLSRSLLRDLIYRFLARKPYLHRLDQAIKKNGWKTVCLLRISPIMPFSVASYALGLTSINFSSYFIGTLATLPALFIYVMLGHLGRQGLLETTTPLCHLLIMGTGAAATLLLILYLGRMAKREYLAMAQTFTADISKSNITHNIFKN